MCLLPVKHFPDRLFSVLFGVMKACREMKRGIVHRNPTAKGTLGQVTRCGAAS